MLPAESEVYFRSDCLIIPYFYVKTALFQALFAVWQTVLVSKIKFFCDKFHNEPFIYGFALLLHATYIIFSYSHNHGIYFSINLVISFNYTSQFITIDSSWLA